MTTRFVRRDLERVLQPLFSSLVLSPPKSRTWNPAPSDEDWRSLSHPNRPPNPHDSISELAQTVFTLPLRFSIYASSLHARGSSVRHALTTANDCERQFANPTVWELAALAAEVSTCIRGRLHYWAPVEVQRADDMINGYIQGGRGWAVYDVQCEILWLAREAVARHETQQGQMSVAELTEMLMQIIGEDVETLVGDAMRFRDEHRTQVMRDARREAPTPGPTSAGDVALRGGDITLAWDNFHRHSLDGVEIPSTRDAFLRGESLEREYFGDILVEEDVIEQRDVDGGVLHTDLTPVPGFELDLTTGGDSSTLQHALTHLEQRRYQLEAHHSNLDTLLRHLQACNEALEQAMWRLDASLRNLALMSPALAYVFRQHRDRIAERMPRGVAPALLNSLRTERERVAELLASFEDDGAPEEEERGELVRILGSIEELRADEGDGESDGEWRTWLAADRELNTVDHDVIDDALTVVYGERTPIEWEAGMGEREEEGYTLEELDEWHLSPQFDD